MAKITLSNILSGFSLQRINDNFQKIQDALNNSVLYRDNPSFEDNTLKSDIDMNGHKLYNLAAPAGDSHAARLQDVKNAIEGLGGQTANLISFSPTAFIKASNIQGAVESVSDNLQMKYVIPDDYFTIGEADYTAAIDKALAASKRVRFLGHEYVRSAPLITDGHTLEGVASELFGSSDNGETRIVFSGVAGDAIINKNTLSEYVGIHFKQKDWTTACNGLRVERAVIARRCLFTHFNGYGQYAYSVNGVPAPFHAYFDNCIFDYNAKHGVVVGNGANSMSYFNCQARWNGSPAYNVPPTVVSIYSGLYADGAMVEFPAGASIEPQQLVVVGGNWSYNSNYGVHLKRCSDSVVIGGYMEVNLAVSDLAIESVYGTTVLNPMVQKMPPVITTTPSDPTNGSRNTTTYPNHITVRGQNYQDGTKTVGAGFFGYRNPMPTYYTWGSGVEMRIVPMADASVEVQADGAQKWKFGDTVTMSAKKWRLGGNQPPDANNYMASPLGETEGNLIFYLVNNGQYGSFEVANGGGANSAGAALKLPKNALTLRGANIGGTVNASGADYAEYIRKAFGCGSILKGQIVGITSNGLITDKWDDAISFAVKSTDPSYVGGDVWWTHLGDRPVDNGTNKEALKVYDAALEEARATVDRIAFAGQVPVNVMEALPGDFIVPVKAGNGIAGVSVTNPTFEQYKSCVGKVIGTEPDGRAKIIVKVV